MRGMSEETEDGNAELVNRAQIGCASGLGFILALLAGCAGGMVVGLLIGRANHTPDAIWPPEIAMTLIGGIIGPIVSSAAYFFVIVVILTRNKH